MYSCSENSENIVWFSQPSEVFPTVGYDQKPGLIQQLDGSLLTEWIFCFHSYSELNPLKYHIQCVSIPYGMLKCVCGLLDVRTLWHFQSHNLQISQRALRTMYNGGGWWRGGTARPTQSHDISQLPRSETASAPRCLIHLTRLLYTVLNVVNSILWQTHYTTTSSSTLPH